MPLVDRTQNQDAHLSEFIAKVASDASGNAIEKALSHGRSVTIQKGETIVKVHPDGRTDTIRKIEKSSVVPEKRIYHL